MGRYATEADALRRVEALKREGRWPGVIRRADGSCDLTWDPQDTALTWRR